MSDQIPQINLISVLPEIVKTKLSSDVYGFLEYNFGLDGAASLEEIRKNVTALDSKAEIKKLLNALNSIMQTLHQDEKSVPIMGELQLLKADLIGSENYVDNFNTEEKLFARLKTHYNLESLTVAQTGIALIAFHLLEFERIDIAGCQIIWKLTHNDVTPKILQTLHVAITDILNIVPEPIEVNVLRRSIGKKNRGKMPDEALLRFILSIDLSIEILPERDAVQVKFISLYDYQMPYRVLLENNNQMTVRQMEEEITQRLKPFGRKIPQVKNFLSGEWYAKGNDGWGLKKWGIKKDEIPDLLKSWFQETKTPATRKQMVEYLQPLRPNLKSIINMVISYEEIVKVEYIQSDLNPRGREELYYHTKVTLPDGVKKLKNSVKISNVKKPKRPELFISYAHAGAGKKFLEEFKAHLLAYEQDDILSIWDDSEIPLGEKWHKSITDALNRADAALFLVTKEFITSKYIKSIELKKIIDRAEKNQIKIYWVHVERCLYEQSPLQERQAAYDINKPLNEMSSSNSNKAIVEISRKIYQSLIKHNG